MDYLIEQAIRNINRLFLLSIKNEADDPTKNVFDNYYIPFVQIKDFNALIDNEPFFDQPVKRKQEMYENHIEMLRNNDYTTGNSLDYLFHQNYHKLIGIGLSRQTNKRILQQINFAEIFQKNDGATMFFTDENQQKTILNFSLDLLIVTE